jgi:hypothetical protein
MFRNADFALLRVYERISDCFRAELAKNYAYSVDVSKTPILNPYSHLPIIGRISGIGQIETFYINGGELELTSFGIPLEGVPIKFPNRRISWERIMNMIIKTRRCDARIKRFVSESLDESLKNERIGLNRRGAMVI